MNIVISYRAIPGRMGWATGDSVYRAFTALGYPCYRYAKIYQSDKWYKCELPEDPSYWLIYCEMNDQDYQYTALFDNPKSLKAYWDFDTAMHPDFTQNITNKFDFNFIAHYDFVNSYPRASYLPYAVDTDLIKPYGELHNKECVAIIGNKFKERVSFADYVGIPVWSNVFNDDYIKAIGLLKVHVHAFDSGGDGLLVSRVWETLGVRTCLLTKSSDSIKRHFTPNYHLATYSDADDCKEKIKALLADDNYRETIADNGYKEVLANHTYLNRVREIISKMS